MFAITKVSKLDKSACLLRPTFSIPKAKANSWRLVWEKLIKRDEIEK